jgi:BlaI family transcriptional regulator, penicillinase repressor
MRLTRLERRIMDALWSVQPASIREVHAALRSGRRSAYTTVQTVIYRLEAKGAVRRAKKVGNAHVFEAVVTRADAERAIVDDVLALFGGRTQPLIAHLIDTGQLTKDDLDDARKRLRELSSPQKEKSR